MDKSCEMKPEGEPFDVVVRIYYLFSERDSQVGNIRLMNIISFGTFQVIFIPKPVRLCVNEGKKNNDNDCQCKIEISNNQESYKQNMKGASPPEKF